jgi:hypothetical protein
MTWTMMTWIFNVTIKISYSKQYDSWYMIEEWLLCNDMDNTDIVVSMIMKLLKYGEPIENWLQID